MKKNLLQSLSMSKYERLLPRLFPGTAWLELHDTKNLLVWRSREPELDSKVVEIPTERPEGWADFGHGINKRQLPGGEIQFRAPLRTRDHGNVGWLVARMTRRSACP